MAVKGADIRWSLDMSGDWLNIRMPNAVKVVGTLNAEKLYDVEIREHKEKRSRDANSYFWALLDKLAAALREPKTEIYRTYVKEIGGNNDVVCVPAGAVDKLRRGWEHNGVGWVTDTMPSKIPGCTNVILYYGSSTYDTAQMSRLVDMVVQDCKEQGIETLPPWKLAALVGDWKCTK